MPALILKFDRLDLVQEVSILKVLSLELKFKICLFMDKFKNKNKMKLSTNFTKD